MALGSRQIRIGAAVGLALSLAVHAAPATQAAGSFPEVGAFSKHVLAFVKDRLKSEVDVEVDPPPPPPPAPEPEPEPEPAKTPEPPPPRPLNEPPPPPPAPAQAAKVITSEPDPEAPVDLTDQGFVTGNAESFAGGITANAGTAKQAVRNVNAVVGGIPGGTGPKTATPPARDLSRPAGLLSTDAWNDCGFPPEADIEGINQMVVQITVTVSPDGRAKAVSVLNDPGFGFGKLARACAMRRRYQTGLDSMGKPVVRTTPPYVLRFRR